MRKNAFLLLLLQLDNATLENLISIKSTVGKLHKPLCWPWAMDRVHSLVRTARMFLRRSFRLS